MARATAMAMAMADLIGMLAGWLAFKVTSRWWPIYDATMALLRQLSQVGQEAIPGFRRSLGASA